MAYTARFVQQALNSQAEYERQLSAIKKVKNWVEKPFILHSKQTDKAVFFKAYGWVPKVAIGGRAPDGLIVPWNQFRSSYHQFLLADWFVSKMQAQK